MRLFKAAGSYSLQQNVLSPNCTGIFPFLATCMSFLATSVFLWYLCYIVFLCNFTDDKSYICIALKMKLASE